MIGLSISTLKIGLNCQPPFLTQIISHHYHDYIVDIHPDMVVNIHWDGPRSGGNIGHSNIADANLEFTQEGLLLSSPGCRGTIDLVSQNAEFSFQSNEPIHEIEYFLRIIVAFGLYSIGGFLFHAAGVVRHNKAYIFFGKSGCGKSTIAKHSANSPILSDDLIGILPTEVGVFAYSTPFWNPGWLQPKPISAKVAGLFRLVQDDRVFLTAIRSSLAVSEILASIPVILKSRKICAGLIPIILQVNQWVSVNYLHFKPDNTFWDIVEQTDLKN